MAKLLRPWQDLVREKLLEQEADLPESVRDRIWYHLTNSYNSDGQWPPTLPHAPHIIHPFNYSYCFENLLTAHWLAGGVDLDSLGTDAAETIEQIIGLQSALIRNKAKSLVDSGSDKEQADARLALRLIDVATENGSLKGQKTLQSGEYTVRADAMIEARRLVGGVVIEDASNA